MDNQLIPHCQFVNAIQEQWEDLSTDSLGEARLPGELPARLSSTDPTLPTRGEILEMVSYLVISIVILNLLNAVRSLQPAGKPAPLVIRCSRKRQIL
ncbi:hypothetical protein H4Q26_009837 [Puccinia striiformis f. sp. tritici PST-130]|nr:hypothetical protein H4Q26_009837 [Puccinia striiformis f. sp. tritici PST-130]